MSETQQPGGGGPTCPVEMSDALPCGRAIYHAPGSTDPDPPCIMHCREATKDPEQFRQEIDAILSGTSADHRHKDRFDFNGFFFPEADFSRATFTRNADFSSATFTQDANFHDATFTRFANFYGAAFTQKADFSRAIFTQDANFLGAIFAQGADFGTTFSGNTYFVAATFTQKANFFHATFARNADFSAATFTQDADFSDATFSQKANFRWTRFRQPELVRFHQVNQREDAPGLRARFVNCRVERVQFANVNWHRPGGRMVLQDELDLTDPDELDPTDPADPKVWRPAHELVAIAYRQLVSNFEKERAYDLAEDCKIGAMEMKRLDPKSFLFAKRLESYYRKWRWLRRLGENLSAASLYRGTSHYGTSYNRALLVLLGLLVIFALLFALPWSAIQRDKPSVPPQGVLNRLGAGLLHSLEVATFQRDSWYGVPTRFGRLASILETILVPAQLALFLLALRRRFRH